MSDGEHVLEASGHWTNDGSSTASVQCRHPLCASRTPTGGWNEDSWPGYDWDGYRRLSVICAEAQAAHDTWLGERS